MKKKTLFPILLFVSILLIVISCEKPKTPETDESELETDLGIDNTIPPSMGSVYVENFNRYTKITAPNGGSIHIVAQNNITDEQIVRCRNILKHYLTDFPGSKYGADKSDVANKMANNNAILCLFNGEDNSENTIEVDGQPLYQNEIQVEGTSWYMNQDYEHRDAAFEEILHLVHDYGIGVDSNEDFIGALPDFQSEIRLAQKNALDKNIWGEADPEWIDELTIENSLTQEYLAAVIDAYYGLWGAWTDGTNSMWGLYVPKVRSEIITKDPMGNELMNNSFFHPYLTYNARIDASFNGTFSLKFDEAKPYTNHSRYLKDITLMGSNNNSVIVNELNNNIIGNTGTNTVIFSGEKSEYTISTDKGITTVTDKTLNRDGTNTLEHVEKLQFTDQTVLI